MKGALHEWARSNGSAGSITLQNLMHLFLADEAALNILYSHYVAFRHHSLHSDGIRKLSRHSVKMLHLYTHVTPRQLFTCLAVNSNDDC